MLQSLARKVFGTQNDRELKSIYPLVDQINSFEENISKLTDGELRAKTDEFKARLAKGETLDQILPEAFAVCREAGKRVLGMRHFDVQLIGGISLHRGKIAEMRTGEGKTLVATLPCYLNALAGRGVHVVTVNDYLARRDAQWMGKLHNFLGLSVGVIVHGLSDSQRKKNYGCDITYGTNNEYGFDYLRDNMKFRLEDYVQRELNFAIVDEVDSILIDEARTPLIISGPTDDSSELYYKIDQQLRVDGGLDPATDYIIDEKSRTASLTELGVDKMEARLGIQNLYDPIHIEVLHHVNQGLRAHVLFKNDVDYVVKDNQVMIVDEFTGRLMPGRRWSDGLHQAIEAKEGVDIENENQTLATITFQNFFRMYNKLSGMTGTADTEATEFKQIYKLDVTVIPTNQPMVRNDQSDMIYKTEQAKLKAIVEDIKQLQDKKQPVLVGTVSVDKSEKLAILLKQHGIKHNVLNAKQHEREADIVAQAGRIGAVTIATNMAGRGTDILLGGNPEALAKVEVGTIKASATEEEKESYQKAFQEALEKWRVRCADERKQVHEAGGLCIVGTERHESRRIDNQLRGRAGRQGDPGASKFYLSLEDDLMRIFGGVNIAKFMEDDVPIEHKWINKAIENAQKKVEAHNYDIRKHLLEYDDVMNQQRKVVYAWRKEVLKSENLKEMVLSMSDEVSESLAQEFFPGGKLKKKAGVQVLDEKELHDAVFSTFAADLEISEKDISPFSHDGLRKLINAKARSFYTEKEKVLGEESLRQIEKMVLLTTIDHLWKDHLLAMDHMRDGIGLQGYGQKDPLIEYKKQGFKFFEMMMSQINLDVLRKIFSVQVAQQSEVYEEQLEEMEAQNQNLNLMHPPLKQGKPSATVSVDEPRSSGAKDTGAMLEAVMNKKRQQMSLTRGNPLEMGGAAGGGISMGGGGGVSQQSKSNPGFAPAPVKDPQYHGVGRNDVCPCGSGKKFKKCHGG